MTRWLVALTCGALILPSIVDAQTLEDYDYENLELRGVGLEFGSVWPANVEQTLSFGARADLGFAGPQVRIVPAIRYWSSSLNDSEVDHLADQVRALCREQGLSCPVELGEIHLSDLELNVGAHYLVDTGYTVTPYVGGGLGLHLLNGRGESIDGTFVEDLLDTVAPAIDAVAGVSVPLGDAIELFSEARYVLVSDVRYASLSIGGMWTLPSPPVAPWREPRGEEAR